jgi:hydroxyacylglutathione hydrolase
VLDVPGHTAGHVAYVLPNATPSPVLFCGDTLFSGGCGRIFEGTPAQMLASLDLLASLPASTRVCCAHEYTLSNLRFALAVEPSNTDLQTYAAHCQQLRAQGVPTLPAQLGLELQINPFLRARHPSVRLAVAQHAGLSALEQTDDVAVFAALRQWKNDFR